MKFVMRATMLVSAMLVVGAAKADATRQVADELGVVVASEAFCELAYDQQAIADFVEARVPANDMSFATNLKLATEMETWRQDGMSASAKTAHCTQIARVAKSYGFTK